MTGLLRLLLLAAMFVLFGGGLVPTSWSASGPAPAPSDAPIFIPIDRITVAVFRDGEVAQHLTFILKLEVVDRNASGLVIEKMPRLTDAFMRDLHVLASAPNAATDGLDMALAKRRLMSTSVRILGPDVVRSVLIDRSIVRKIS